MIIDNIVFFPTWANNWERDFEMANSVATTRSGATYVVQRWPYPKRVYTIPFESMAAVAANSPNAPSIQQFTNFYMLRGGTARGFLLWDLFDCYIDGLQIGTGDGSTTEFQIVQPFNDGTNSFDRTIYHPAPSAYYVSQNPPADWSSSVTYSAGSYVLGSDSNVYYCLLASSLDQDPTATTGVWVESNGTYIPTWIQGSVGGNSIAPFTVKVSGTTVAEGTAYTVDYSTGLITFLSGHVPASGHTITVTCAYFTPVMFTEETEGVTMNSLFGKASVKLREVFYS